MEKYGAGPCWTATIGEDAAAPGNGGGTSYSAAWELSPAGVPRGFPDTDPAVVVAAQRRQAAEQKHREGAGVAKHVHVEKKAGEE